MIPHVIRLSLLTSFSTVLIRVLISHRPFLVRNTWHQILGSTIAGAILWVMLLYLTSPTYSRSAIGWADVLCGILIFLCAFWCNYWSGNLAGGFRVQMQMNLADQRRPISLKEWMAAFGGLGMEVFLRDRMESVLIPLKAVAFENGYLRLLMGWGVLFSKIMILLRVLLPKVRGD